MATPPGVGGVGIIRVSGPDALAILRRLCPALPGDLQSHKLYLTQARCPQRGEVLDEVLAVYMKTPRSYTGEDVCEIQGHGGALNMARLLEAACNAGAVLAEPGEFTRRAFLNGRMDLTQAEAVADVIHASSQAALRLAQRHLAGQLGESMARMQQELVVAVTLTEAAIDFSTEEHVYQLDSTEQIGRLEGLIGEAKRLLGTFDAGRQLREGVQVVIVGRPNAGKSTLFNRLCGQPRAIVTDIPGTTRDYLEELVQVGGVTLRLVDTAGLRATEDVVERLGVDRSLEQASGADLILWVIDASAPLALDDRERALLEQAAGADVLPVLNKADLPGGLLDADRVLIESMGTVEAVAVSLLDGQGGEALLGAVEAVAARRLAPAAEGVTITRQRHRQALSKATEAMERALEATQMGLSHEFIALDLRLALEALGEMLGRVTIDDILGRIFSDFCVGK